MPDQPPPPGREGPRALLVAAGRSGAGKSVTTLGLLRALRRRGLRVAAAKSGPDYLDPAFHSAATGAPAITLDPWAMGGAELRARAAAAAEAAELLVIEGAMGVLDSAAAPAAKGRARGSAADLAAARDAPIALVLDMDGQAQTAAALAAGLKALRPDLRLGGVILNRVGSARHARLATDALARCGVTVWGALPRSPALGTPSRHLGLVQARERPDLDAFIEGAADLIAERLDLDAIIAAAHPLAGPPSPVRTPPIIPPLGGRIAVARDDAFAFIYPHVLADWRAAGAEIVFFSPLQDEPPDASADAVYLPGGYPELHAPTLSGALTFHSGLRRAAARGAWIYGECGGYMALGEGLIDADGRRWPMAGMLPVSVSFAERRLQLGYRRLRLREAGPFGDPGAVFYGHEHHYSVQASRDPGVSALFEAWDAAGAPQPDMGAMLGRVLGSYAHLIAPG
ncbi:MAG: cobyrinate a,c-diamide synthase [Pseudomonadota bacterium]